MEVNFFKSLDRPVDVFGVKGRWLTVFLVLAGLGVVLAFIVGSVFGSGAGVATALACLFGSFLVCLSSQEKMPHRRLARSRCASMLPSHVTRRETLCRVLLKDRAYEDSIKDSPAQQDCKTT